MSLPNELPADRDPLGRHMRKLAQRRYPERAVLEGPGFIGPDPRALETVLRNSLRPQMALYLQAGKYRDHDSLMDDYSRSVAVLRQAAEDVRGLARRLWRLNVRHVSNDQFVQQIEGAFSEQYYGSMVGVAVDCVNPPLGAVSARLEARPVEDAEVELRGRLDRDVEKLVAEVKDLFGRMDRLELVGRIDWATDSACDSYYFEDVVVHEKGDTQTYYGLSRESQPDYMLGARRVRQETLDVTNTRHTVHHGIHIKVLGKAREHRIGDFRGVVPKEVGEYLQATPLWVREMLRIVDGKTRFDNVVDVEIDLAERKVGEPKVREWVLPAYCPLVTIGDYVLTGWGNREGTIETARQNYAWLYVLAFSLLALSGVLTGLGRVMSPWLAYVATVPAILSIVAFVEGRREQAISRQQSMSLLAILGSAIVWFVLCLGIQALGVGISTMNWILIGLGLLLTWVAASGLLPAKPSTATRK